MNCFSVICWFKWWFVFIWWRFICWRVTIRHFYFIFPIQIIQKTIFFSRITCDTSTMTLVTEFGVYVGDKSSVDILKKLPTYQFLNCHHYLVTNILRVDENPRILYHPKKQNHLLDKSWALILNQVASKCKFDHWNCLFQGSKD